MKAWKRQPLFQLLADVRHLCLQQLGQTMIDKIHLDYADAEFAGDFGGRPMSNSCACFGFTRLQIRATAVSKTFFFHSVSQKASISAGSGTRSTVAVRSAASDEGGRGSRTGSRLRKQSATRQRVIFSSQFLNDPRSGLDSNS